MQKQLPMRTESPSKGAIRSGIQRRKAPSTRKTLVKILRTQYGGLIDVVNALTRNTMSAVPQSAQILDHPLIRLNR
jgi:hypothetical protein